ncbi:hypothetical protein ABZP36_019344 [Zizania latifolia]
MNYGMVNLCGSVHRINLRTQYGIRDSKDKSYLSITLYNRVPEENSYGDMEKACPLFQVFGCVKAKRLHRASIDYNAQRYTVAYYISQSVPVWLVQLADKQCSNKLTIS